MVLLFDMMRSFGISYSYAGENIAKGQRSADEVVTAWMNSPGHRANILNGNYTHIGIGHTSSQDYWTQMFIGKKITKKSADFGRFFCWDGLKIGIAATEKNASSTSRISSPYLNFDFLLYSNTTS
ncbi:hypothetical protein GCM10020331_072940 [Ectobacillus funiculus]